MDIIAAFDIDESIVGTVLHNKQIMSLDKLPSVCSRMKIKIGIIAVTAEEAQKACNLLVDSGILAIWNFAPVHLQVPQQVVVKNENLGSSLAILSNYLVEKIKVI
jgi:redox-sensing transcriptional repressor